MGYGMFEFMVSVGLGIMIVVYGFVTEFGPLSDPNFQNVPGIDRNTLNYYPFWLDVHVMIYIGFGFLMVFMRTGSWGAVVLNFMVAAWVTLVVLIVDPFWHMVFTNNF